MRAAVSFTSITPVWGCRIPALEDVHRFSPSCRRPLLPSGSLSKLCGHNMIPEGPSPGPPPLPAFPLLFAKTIVPCCTMTAKKSLHSNIYQNYDDPFNTLLSISGPYGLVVFRAHTQFHSLRPPLNIPPQPRPPQPHRPPPRLPRAVTFRQLHDALSIELIICNLLSHPWTLTWLLIFAIIDNAEVVIFMHETLFRWIISFTLIPRSGTAGSKGCTFPRVQIHLLSDCFSKGLYQFALPL